MLNGRIGGVFLIPKSDQTKQKTLRIPQEIYQNQKIDMITTGSLKR